MTHTLVAKLMQCSSLQYAANNATDVCETLILDVVPEANQNDHSYVCELSRPTFDSLCKMLAQWAVTRRTSKTTRLSKLGGAWALARGWALARDNMVYASPVVKGSMYNSIMHTTNAHMNATSYMQISRSIMVCVVWRTEL